MYRLQTYLTHYFGSEVLIETYELLTRRASIVARVGLKDAKDHSVIVKHAPDFTYAPNSSSLEFREEQLAYSFLQKITAKGKYKPELVGLEKGRVLIMEDLGTKDQYSQNKSFNYLVPKLAKSIAHLHGAAYGKYDEYVALRPSMDLKLDKDERRYGKDAYELLYRKGKDYLLNRYDLSPVRTHQSTLFSELDNILKFIKNPQSYLSLIHDDLGNVRQTYEFEGKLLLLDFEYSKYTHMLLDFVKPMIGKFEESTQDGFYRWTQTQFPLALTKEYRKHLKQDYNLSFDDEEWDFNLYCALSYGAIGLIGRLCYLEPEKRLLGSVLENMKGILNRLNVLLQEINQGSVIRDYIRCFLNDT